MARAVGQWVLSPSIITLGVSFMSLSLRPTIRDSKTPSISSLEPQNRGAEPPRRLLSLSERIMGIWNHSSYNLVCPPLSVQRLPGKAILDVIPDVNLSNIVSVRYTVRGCNRGSE